MIFDKDYDNSLWYIIKSDKRKNKNIVSFLSELPNELVNNIRISIENLKNGKMILPDDEDAFYNFPSKEDDRVVYSFDLALDYGLTISKYYLHDDYIEGLYELVLYPLNLQEAKEMRNSDEEWIGSVTDSSSIIKSMDNNSMKEFFETEYILHRTNVGHFISFNLELFKGKYDFPMFKPILINNTPFEIELDKDNKNVKRLSMVK